MTGTWSKFGDRYTRPTGALELMQDLGAAMDGEHSMLLLGGGNPGSIPEVQAIFRRRLAEIAASDENFERLVGKYAHPQGERRFRRLLAELLVREYGWDLTVDNIALTAGSQAGFFLLFNLLAGEFSDGSRRRILLPITPEYIGYTDVGLGEDHFVAQLPIIRELPDNFFKYHVNFDDLKVTDDIAAICVSRPTNPTGNVITDTELSKLDRMARAADVPLIVDSAYGLPFPRIVFTESTPLWNDNVILCMSLSKLGLPGVRTGIIIANEEIIAALTRMIAVLSLAVGSVGPVLLEQFLASGEILSLSQKLITPFYRSKALAACQLLQAQLDGIPYKIHIPEGAFFLWLWLPGLPIRSAALYERLKNSGVLVISGHHFFPGVTESWPHRDECLRISFAQDDDIVERGIGILAAEIKRSFAE
ncbi:MAG: valine--pyruvate transaminase [Gammaproteobacteria bacterium]|nr:valine--pyruvate transaminase [Gammaproteobacteria bacterium]